MRFPSLSSHPTACTNNAGSGNPFGTVASAMYSLISCIAMHCSTRLVGIARELQHDARDQVLLVPVKISVSFISRLMNIDVA